MACPDMQPILAGLKDFQRATVDVACSRLYGPGGSRRFLVADEVGLGKTLIARGIIARTLERLWDEEDRIDIVYLCSSAGIARQNIQRLRIPLPGQGEFTPPTRLTLLPTAARSLGGNRVNYLSFTPGTSLDLKSRMGVAEERVLLFHLLRAAWRFTGDPPAEVLRGDKNPAGFRAMLGEFRADSIEPALAERFQRALAGQPKLQSEFERLCERFGGKTPPNWDDRDRRAAWIGRLRFLLAESCLQALRPDLVIVDEFQRFKHLLRPNDDDRAAQLAQRLFAYAEGHTHTRVLLLSATPYKMYTLAHETDDDHHRDFVDTLRFLLDCPNAVRRTETLLREYRRELYRLGDRDGSSRLAEVKAELEGELRRVMVRTERLAVTEDRNGMLTQAVRETPALEARDLHGYLALQEVARRLPGTVHRDALEYWKTAPYLLNFMEDYELKARLRVALSPAAPPEPARALARELARDTGLLFPAAEWESYRRVDPGNARLRQLLRDTIARGTWKLLWLPPALPYYPLAGPFDTPGARSFTKRLIFSAWQVVPRAVAPLVSYEAERCMLGSGAAGSGGPRQMRQRRRPLLRFAQSAERDRPNRGLTGMPVFTLIYPSLALARLGDPLRAARELNAARKRSDGPTLKALRRHVQAQIETRLEQLRPAAGPAGPAGPADENWYWAAPLLLDLQQDPEATRAWLLRRDLSTRWSEGPAPGEEEEGDRSHWEAHLQLARDFLADPARFPLGRRPKDLALTLAQLALAAPGTAALRALTRDGAGTDGDVEIRDGAARIGWGFRSLFNVPEFTFLIRERHPEVSYWRRVLEYCLQGCLQASLDEYAHLLGESLGLGGASAAERASAIAGAMTDALTLRTAAVQVDDFALDPAEPSAELHRGALHLRCRYALRFGDQHSETGAQVARAGQVRDAFNSPFWPFVLITTSVGQEGLDFHPYCHAVVHWDLPSNPVDLEQREGRVHRYKGHAVRKNLALRYGRRVLETPVGPDPWSALFTLGSKERPAGATDLVPYWIFPHPHGASIERHVYGYPLSRDQERFDALRRSLALYRMVFGQPHQEDLLAYLHDRLPETELRHVLDQNRIDLSPAAAPNPPFYRG